jgi:hypothetical protein
MSLRAPSPFCIGLKAIRHRAKFLCGAHEQLTWCG